MIIRCEFCRESYEIGHSYAKPERSDLILEYAQCTLCGYWRTDKGRLSQYEDRCLICGIPKSALQKYLPNSKMCVSCFTRREYLLKG